MINQTTQNLPLSNFLDTILGSKEVGLVIAKDSQEQEWFASFAEEKGFKKAGKISDLFDLPQAYLILDENTEKSHYDFAVQYPTGQVEIFDKESMKSQIFSPDYKNKGIIFIVGKDDLNKLQAKGLDLLSATGPAFQS